MVNLVNTVHAGIVTNRDNSTKKDIKHSKYSKIALF